MSEIRREERESVLEAIDEGIQHIHISGQPGVGKTYFLTNLTENLPDGYESKIINVRENHDDTTLIQNLLYEIRQSLSLVTRFFSRISGGSAGAFGFSGGIQLEDRKSNLRKLADLSESYPKTSHLVLCIDDIHKITEGNPDRIRDLLQELAGSLADNILLVTAGQITVEKADHVVDLGMFTEEETRQFLNDQFPGLDDETKEEVHEQLDGHPYYLSLLSEATEPNASLEFPEEDFYQSIEGKYLDSLSTEEEVFLRQTAPLTELNETVCQAIQEDTTKTDARRILNSLSNKVIVRELGRSQETGENIYKVHDLFRGFLYERLEEPERVHRAAFQFYSRELFEIIDDSDMPPLEGFAVGMLARNHLNQIYDGNPSIDNVRSEIGRLDFDPSDRLRFVFGFVPLAPDDPESLLIPELDDFRELLANSEIEEDKGNLAKEFGLVMIDIMRAHFRLNADTEYEPESTELLEGSIQRIQNHDFVQFLEEEGVGQNEDFAQMLSDMMELICHATISYETDNHEVEEKHRDSAYGLLENYGLNRSATEAVVNNFRELGDDFEPGDEMEEFVEKRIEKVLNEVDDGGLTRVTLTQVQSGFKDEFVSWVNALGTAMVSESDRALEFILDSGETLGEAENPIFAAAWYQIWRQIYQLFAPEADTTKQLEESYRRYAELRREYEAKQLESPIVEIDNFEESELELPAMFGDLPEKESNREILNE